MTDPPAPEEPASAAEVPPETAVAEPTPLEKPTRPNRALPVLLALALLVLAGAIAFLWSQQRHFADAQRLEALSERVARVEEQPHPAADLPALSAQVDALAERVDTLEKRPVQDLQPLENRIAALEQRPAPDLRPLEARIAALEQRPAGDPELHHQLDTVTARVNGLAGQDQTSTQETAKRLDAVEAHLSALEHVSSSADRVARVEAAEAALAAGQKLGEIPGAPPALARFASTPPPTEAALRLAFPKAEQAALAASTPAAGKPLLARMLARAQELLIVRQGDHVLVGNPAAGVLARAQEALDAGDLNGAIAAVESLTGPPRQAMDGWLADAKALADARAALADMAAHS
ncbi:MAG: hypothetical protein JO227_00300 [Acetobacteraceae bacterium]|nr:hypothetical protein [Acetobacteraceae bacterium]